MKGNQTFWKSNRKNPMAQQRFCHENGCHENGCHENGCHENGCHENGCHENGLSILYCTLGCNRRPTKIKILSDHAYLFFGGDT